MDKELLKFMYMQGYSSDDTYDEGMIRKARHELQWYPFTQSANNLRRAFSHLGESLLTAFKPLGESLKKLGQDYNGQEG